MRDRMYGSRNLYWGGMIGGNMDIKVTNAGIEWYGRKVARRLAVLNSCILSPCQNNPLNTTL